MWKRPSWRKVPLPRKRRKKAEVFTAQQSTSRVVTRSSSRESSVPRWKKTRDENCAIVHVAFFEQFGEVLLDRPQDMPVSPPKPLSKMPAKANKPDNDEFCPEEEVDGETVEEVSSEEDRRKGKASKQAAKSSAAETKTAVEPTTHSGMRSRASRKERPSTVEKNHEVPAKRPYFNFSTNDTLCLYVLNYVIENRQHFDYAITRTSQQTARKPPTTNSTRRSELVPRRPGRGWSLERT